MTKVALTQILQLIRPDFSASANSQEFEVLPRRWLVERTFAWLVQNRRLAVDYEQLPEISEALNILVLLVI